MAANSLGKLSPDETLVSCRLFYNFSVAASFG